MRRPVSSAALALALLLSGAAAAQSNVRPIDETAADLAYGLCPLYLAGQIELTDAQFADRGFSTRIDTVQNARFGEVKTITAKLADGEITFGGAPQKTCSVIVGGPNRIAALARLRDGMALMGLEFAPDPANTGIRSGAKVETFKAKADATSYLYVQLIETDNPMPMVSAQLFAMDQ